MVDVGGLSLKWARSLARVDRMDLTHDRVMGLGEDTMASLAGESIAAGLHFGGRALL